MLEKGTTLNKLSHNTGLNFPKPKDSKPQRLIAELESCYESSIHFVLL